MFSLTTGLKVDSQSFPNVDQVRISRVGCIWCLYRAAPLIFPGIKLQDKLVQVFLCSAVSASSFLPIPLISHLRPPEKGEQTLSKAL